MTAHGVTIRTAGEGDLAAMAAAEAAADTAEWIADSGPAWQAAALADPQQEQLLAEDADGAFAGFAVLAGLDGGPVAELRRIVVRPAARGRGLGRALLRAALERAHTVHGAERVWLDVLAANRRARSLYASEGFAVTYDDGERLVVMVHHGAKSG